jgi:hypothetical protein
MKYDQINYDGWVLDYDTCISWGRDQMRPLAKHVAIARADGVNRTLLWNAGAEQERDYVFKGVLPGWDGKTIPPAPSPKAFGNNGEASQDDLLSIIADRLQGKIAAASDEEKLLIEVFAEEEIAEANRSDPPGPEVPPKWPKPPQPRWRHHPG